MRLLLPLTFGDLGKRHRWYYMGRLYGGTPGELENHIPTSGFGRLLKPEYFTQDHFTAVVAAIVGASRCRFLSLLPLFSPPAHPRRSRRPMNERPRKTMWSTEYEGVGPALSHISIGSGLYVGKFRADAEVLPFLAWVLGLDCSVTPILPWMLFRACSSLNFVISH